MKRMILTAMLGMALLGATMPTTTEAAAKPGRGGVGGFFIGCCFGPRTVTQWNDGSDIHWREWLRIIPYVGLVFGIWDGIEGAQGMTTAEFEAKYGADWY